MKSLIFILFFMLSSVSVSHAAVGALTQSAREELDAIINEGSVFVHKFDNAPHGQYFEIVSSYLQSPIPKNLYALVHKYRNNLSKSVSAQVLVGLDILAKLNIILGRLQIYPNAHQSQAFIHTLTKHVRLLREFQALARENFQARNWAQLESFGAAFIANDDGAYAIENQILVSMVLGICARSTGQYNLAWNYFNRASEKVIRLPTYYSGPPTFIDPTVLSASIKETHDEFLNYLVMLFNDLESATISAQQSAGPISAVSGFHRSSSLPSLQTEPNPPVVLPAAPLALHRSISLPSSPEQFSLFIGLSAVGSENFPFPLGLPVPDSALVNAGMGYLPSSGQPGQRFYQYASDDPVIVRAAVELYFNPEYKNGIFKPLHSVNLGDLRGTTQMIKVIGGEGHPQIAVDYRRLAMLFIRRHDLIERGLRKGFVALTHDHDPAAFAREDLLRAQSIAHDYGFVPQSATVQLRLGKKYIQSNELSLARVAFESVISLNSTLISLYEYDRNAEPKYFMSRAYRGLADVYRKLNQDQEVVHFLSKAMEALIQSGLATLSARDHTFLDTVQIELNDAYGRLARTI